MNEDILQYIWNYKKFRNFDFISTDGRKIEILEFGEWNKNSGPDFLFAKIVYFNKNIRNLVFQNHR